MIMRIDPRDPEWWDPRKGLMVLCLLCILALYVVGTVATMLGLWLRTLIGA